MPSGVRAAHYMRGYLLERLNTSLQCAKKPDVQPSARSADAPDALLDAVLLHCLAHVGASAAAIKRNSERLKAGSSGADNASEAHRDQGFTRPKACAQLHVRAAAGGGPLAVNVCERAAAAGADD